MNDPINVIAEAYPSHELTVHVTTNSSEMSILSNTLRFQTTVNEDILELTVHSEGIHFIEFSLSGNDADVFLKPKSMIVIALSSTSNHSTYSYFDNQLFGILPPGICDHDVQLCSNLLSNINLLSSCSWDGNQSSGIIFIEHQLTPNTYYSIPISIIGAILQDEHPYIDLPSSQESCSPCSTVSNDTTLHAEHIVDLIKSQALPRTWLSRIKSLLPEWLSLKITGEESLHDNHFEEYNLITAVVQGKNVNLIRHCGDLNLKDEEVYIVMKYNGTIEYNTYTPQHIDEPVCFAVSICDSHSPVHISVTDVHQDDLEKIESIKVNDFYATF